MFLTRSQAWHFLPLWSQESAWGQTLVSDVFIKGWETHPETSATFLYIYQLGYFHMCSNTRARLFKGTMGMKEAVRTLVLHCHKRCHPEQGRRCVQCQVNASALWLCWFSGRRCSCEIPWDCQECFRPKGGQQTMHLLPVWLLFIFYFSHSFADAICSLTQQLITTHVILDFQTSDSSLIALCSHQNPMRVNQYLLLYCLLWEKVFQNNIVAMPSYWFVCLCLSNCQSFKAFFYFKGTCF